MSQQQQRKGREGSRWINERPDSDEIAEWFASVPLHDGMTHDRYINGIVLIEQEIKSDGQKVGETFTPYPKVETRVQYFWDLMQMNPDWLGVIEPVGPGHGTLPPGFGSRLVDATNRADKPIKVPFVTCTMQVRVFDRRDYKETVIRGSGRNQSDVKVIRTGKTHIEAPPATKMVAMLDRWSNADPHSMMKAETGAMGRALGMAGMLVVPGAGVATAEDMREAQAMEGVSAPGEPSQAAALPTDEQPQGIEELRARVATSIASLKAEDEAAHAALMKWAKEDRGFESLNDLNETALKGVIRKAEKALDEVQQAKADGAESTQG